MTLSEQAAELQRQWERRTDQSAPPVYFILDAIRQLAEADETRKRKEEAGEHCDDRAGEHRDDRTAEG